MKEKILAALSLLSLFSGAEVVDKTMTEVEHNGPHSPRHRLMKKVMLSNTWPQHNGKREIARRKRQLDAGTLRTN